MRPTRPYASPQPRMDPTRPTRPQSRFAAGRPADSSTTSPWREAAQAPGVPLATFNRADLDAFAAVHDAQRHRTIVVSSPLPCVTYVFSDPVRLHLADGWRITDEGDSHEPDAPSHHWYELRRP